MNKFLIDSLYSLVRTLGLVCGLLLIMTACNPKQTVGESATVSVPEVVATGTSVSTEGEMDKPEKGDSPTILSENRWVLSQVIYDGEAQDISALYPTFFIFDVKRDVMVFRTPCEGTDHGENGYSFDISFQEQNHYILDPHEVLAVDCGEAIDRQTSYVKVMDAFRYEIGADSLSLMGEEFQIVLEKEVDNEDKFLSESGWLLSSIIHQGEVIDITALELTYFIFYTDRNYLLVNTPCKHDVGDRIGRSYEVVFQKAQTYEATYQEIPLRLCDEFVEDLWAELRVVDTFRYEVDGDEVRLLGDDIFGEGGEVEDGG